MKGFSESRRMAFSFLEYLFFVLEIFTFLYYANEESDDVINSSTKTIKYWIIILNISRNIGAVIFKQAMYNTKETNWHLIYHYHGNTLDSSLFLWKTKYPHLQPFKARLVLTLANRLLGVTDPCVRWYLGILVVINTGSAA